VSARRTLAGLACVTLLLAAASKAAAGTERVVIDSLAFAPAKITVHDGDTVEWINKDFVDHTATADKGEWDVPLPAHGTGRIVLKTPGHVSYFCKIHPTMKGEIDVLP
jgi:plastocyanin